MQGHLQFPTNMGFVVLILMGFAAGQSASFCTDGDCLASDYESMLQAGVSVRNDAGATLQSEDQGQFSSEAEADRDQIFETNEKAVSHSEGGRRSSGCSNQDLKDVFNCAKTKPSCTKAFNCGNGQHKKKDNYCEPRWFDLCRNIAVKKCAQDLGKSNACITQICDKYDECKQEWCCDCLESNKCKKECKKRTEEDAKEKYSAECVKDLKQGQEFLEFESDFSTQFESNASAQENRVDSVEDSLGGKRTC